MPVKSATKLHTKVRVKQPRTALYQTAQGALFVPLPDMWRLHDLARDVRARGWPETLPVAHVYARLKEMAPQGMCLPVTAQHWFDRYRDVDWFIPWLLRGRRQPADVTVPSEQVIEKCTRAWYDAAICRAAGITQQTYDAWFQGNLIKDLSWLKWLYGGAPPKDCFVVGRELMALRSQGTPEAISKAAGFNSAALRRWRNNRPEAQALELLLSIAASSGGHLPDLKDQALRKQIRPKTISKMARYARASTWAARCVRAEIAASYYQKGRAEAERLGVSDAYLRYLTSADGSPVCKAGFFAEHFFVPSPGMLAFRDAASKAASREGLWKITPPLWSMPGVDDWFLDWSVPRQHKDNRRLLSKAVGRPTGPTDEVTSPSALPHRAAEAVRTGPSDDGLEWSPPKSPSEWSKIFDVHYNTMIQWLKNQTVRNQQVTPRRYKVAKEEIPD